MKLSKLTATLALAALTTATAQTSTCRWVQDPDKHFGNMMLLCESSRPLVPLPMPRPFDPFEYPPRVTRLSDDPFASQPGEYDPRAALQAQLMQTLRAQTDLHVACIKARGTFKNNLCTW